METETGVMYVEDGGRGHLPRNTQPVEAGKVTTNILLGPSREADSLVLAL